MGGEIMNEISRRWQLDGKGGVECVEVNGEQEGVKMMILMICPLTHAECLADKCAWWLDREGGGCAIVWIPVWLERLTSRVGVD